MRPCLKNPGMPEYAVYYMSQRNLLIIACLLLLCLALGGCFKQSGNDGPEHDIFWPKPPETKRIQFVSAVSKPADLNIHAGFFKQFADYIAGRPEASIVSPYGVATDAEGRIYVADKYLKKVHVFNAAGNDYFSFPADSGRLALPVDIAVDEDGLVYITDAKAGVVKIFTDTGKGSVSELGGESFERPTGIAINRETSELLVVDTLKSKVFRYDRSSRELKGSFGGKGGSEGAFNHPTHICVAPSGRIIVSDSLNFRVQVFSPKGEFLHKFGQMGHGPGSFSRPKGVAADSDGNIYVVDTLFDNIQVFSKEGRLLMAFGDHGTEYGQFWLPNSIHISAQDVIYVSDSSNKRVQVFNYLKEDDVK